MCFQSEQIKEVLEKNPKVGDLLLENLLPLSVYYGPNIPKGLERIADDIAITSGEIFDYGPKEFSIATLLRVLKYLTIPVEGTTWLERIVYDKIEHELEEGDDQWDAVLGGKK